MSIIFTNIAYSENIKTFQMMFFRFFPSAIIIFIVFGKSMFPINKTAVINGLLLGIINFASYAFELLAVSKSQPSKVAFLLSVTDCCRTPYQLGNQEKDSTYAYHNCRIYNYGRCRLYEP